MIAQRERRRSAERLKAVKRDSNSPVVVIENSPTLVENSAYAGKSAGKETTPAGGASAAAFASGAMLPRTGQIPEFTGEVFRSVR